MGSPQIDRAALNRAMVCVSILAGAAGATVAASPGRQSLTHYGRSLPAWSPRQPVRPASVSERTRSARGSPSASSAAANAARLHRPLFSLHGAPTIRRFAGTASPRPRAVRRGRSRSCSPHLLLPVATLLISRLLGQRSAYVVLCIRIAERTIKIARRGGRGIQHGRRWHPFGLAP